MLRYAAFVLPLVPLAIGQSPILPTDDCPILGPSFPSDFDLTNSMAIKEAIAAFPSLIDTLFEGEIPPLNKSATSFQIDVFSTQTNTSIYNYSHTGDILAPALTAGVLDDGTQFRIGSVSKLYTTYAMLNVAGLEIFDHPVTKYLPELAGNTEPSDKIIWEEVTVGALASQQGGSGGFLLGTATCFQTETCDVQAFLAEMRDIKRPVIPAFQTAMYSDAGFGILGRVLERLTNQTYEDALQTHLAEPLGLKFTRATVPPTEGLNALAIPPGEGELQGFLSSWAQDNHITAPSGGIYSNTHDMRLTGLSILHNQLLCANTTREWMKPRSHTASLTMSVGAPWEIYRLTIPVSPNSNRTRVSDLYTKLGGQVAYSAIFALSPDHGICYSILIAGETAATTDRTYLRDLVGSTFIPAAEFAAFENALTNYPGTFADPNNEASNLTIAVDEGKPGLALPSLFVDGVDWRSNITQPGLQKPSDLFSSRLYPNGVEYPSEGAEPQPRTQVEGGEGLFENGCTAWETTGFFTTSDFELEVVEGRLMSVRMMDSNVTMNRVSDEVLL
ncbi:beta-lactamase/transpeptidase-like protein [Zopfia rhizophila CBS 207.26]|uniref:Beta-lactamase/transpeptidase-like protein n=1 Tax=Zopfia rhizophila CBS 207.26 TaxID=1314779 RepID=A0A6A6EBQ7_9PEZI|nr:beta-lactamase/transpeptidase-like protein [Zopfia rhizophila CBS 207.26]